MRITFNMKFSQGLDSILNTQNKLSRAENQLSKQTKILSPADDPAASAKVISLDQNLHRVEQYQNNGVLLKNNLALEETILSSMRTTFDRVKTLSIAAGNGTYTESERQALALELKTIQTELFDLMNTKNEAGSYIFSGFQDKTPAYSKNSATGQYEFQGDDGYKALQISSTISLASNDSGKAVFENVDTRYKTTAASVTGSINSANIAVMDQAAFDNFFKQHYDGVTAANNDFTVRFTSASAYEVLQGGAAMTPPVTGSYSAGENIRFNGIDISVSGTAAMGDEIDFAFVPPEKKNILNTISDFITALEDPTISPEDMTSVIQDTVTQITNASTVVDNTVSNIGGKVNVLDSVSGTNEDLMINDKSYRADISEVDYAAAMTEITKQQISLEAISKVFTQVSRTNLFDYI